MGSYCHPSVDAEVVRMQDPGCRYYTGSLPRLGHSAHFGIWLSTCPIIPNNWSVQAFRSQGLMTPGPTAFLVLTHRADSSPGLQWCLGWSSEVVPCQVQMCESQPVTVDSSLNPNTGQQEQSCKHKGKVNMSNSYSKTW